MAQATAAIPTTNASRYLQQLCKHWSHKFSVEFDPQHGRIEFPAATLELDAAAETLNLKLQVADPAGLERMTDVVAEHLKRFAFREELAFDWTVA